MKKKVKVSIVVASSIVAVIVAAVLIMSFVNVSPMNHFKGYERVAVLTSSQYEKAETAESKSKISKALKTTKFSVMHAVLEGKFDYSPNVIKNNDGGYKYVTADQIKAFSPSSSTQMLKFYYNETKEFTYGKNVLKYDRLILEFAYGDGEIVNATCTLYLDANIDNDLLNDEADENGLMGSIYYQVPQFNIRMNTSNLYNVVSEIK